jgi:hypothetical protein
MALVVCRQGVVVARKVSTPHVTIWEMDMDWKTRASTQSPWCSQVVHVTGRIEGIPPRPLITVYALPPVSRGRRGAHCAGSRQHCCCHLGHLHLFHASREDRSKDYWYEHFDYRV